MQKFRSISLRRTSLAGRTSAPIARRDAIRTAFMSLASAAWLTFALTFAANADFNDGLVLYFPLDEGEGSTANDFSDFGHHGVIDNPSWTNGKFKGALAFAGAGSGTFITVESTDDLNVNEMTFMAWINSNNWDGTRQIVGKSVHGGCGGRTQYGLFSENGIFRLRFETAGGRRDVDTDLPATGEWVHVAFSNDGTTARLYVDGEEASSGDMPGELNANGDPWRLAQDCDRPNNVFDGSIDEARLWNRALSADEIETYMDQGADHLLSVDPAGRASMTWGRLKAR